MWGRPRTGSSRLAPLAAVCCSPPCCPLPPPRPSLWWPLRARHAGVLVTSGVWSLTRHLVHALLDIAMRMAAVFTIAGSTILRRTETRPPWLTVMGYVIGAVMFVAINFYAWLELLFPLWVFVLSAHILVAGFSRPTPS